MLYFLNSFKRLTNAEQRPSPDGCFGLGNVWVFFSYAHVRFHDKYLMDIQRTTQS